MKFPSSLVQWRLNISEMKTRKQALEVALIAANHLQKIDKYLPCTDWGWTTFCLLESLMVVYGKEIREFQSDHNISLYSL